MAKKPKRAISGTTSRKRTLCHTQNIKRKKITAHITDRKRTRSLKNLAITKPVPSGQTEETLREAERFLNDVFASIQDGISILDKDMNIIRVNQTMERWYSHAMPLVGKKCYEAYHGRKERCDVCPTHQTILTGKGAYEVVPKVGPDGKIDGWLDLYSFPLIDTVTGKMKGVIEYVRDITERKRAEELLRVSEAKFEQLFDEAPVGYHEYDTQGRITKVNRTELEILGYTHEEVLGQPVWKFIGDEETSRQMVLAKIAGTIPPGHSFERAYRRKDGTTLTVLIEDRPLRDIEGKIIGIRSTIQDITERKRAEDALLIAAQQWRTTFDGISDIVCLLDQEGKIIKCNKALTDLLGKPFGEIINHTHLEIVHGAPIPIEECPVERLWKTHHRETDILLINDRWFSIGVDPILDEAGRLVGAVHIMSDVTERKRAEEALRQSEEKYRTILESIEDGYYEEDLAGNFVFFNEAMCRIYGYPKEELLGLNYKQYTDEEHCKKIVSAI